MPARSWRLGGRLGLGGEGRGIVGVEIGQHGGGGAGDGGVLGGIGRTGRGRSDRGERGVDRAGAGAVVGVLGIPGGDGGVVDRRMHQRQDARAAGHVGVGAQDLVEGELVPAEDRPAGSPEGDLVERGGVALGFQGVQLPELGGGGAASGGGGRRSWLPELSRKVGQLPAVGSIWPAVSCAAMVVAAAEREQQRQQQPCQALEPRADGSTWVDDSAGFASWCSFRSDRS